MKKEDEDLEDKNEDGSDIVEISVDLDADLKWYQLRTLDKEILSHFLKTGLIISILEILMLSVGIFDNPRYHILSMLFLFSIVTLLPNSINKSAKRINYVLVPTIIGGLSIIYLSFGFVGWFVYFNYFSEFLEFYLAIYAIFCLVFIPKQDKMKHFLQLLILVALHFLVIYLLNLAKPNFI